MVTERQKPVPKDRFHRVSSNTSCHMHAADEGMGHGIGDTASILIDHSALRVLSIRIEKKVNYFYEVTTSDGIRRSTLSVKVSRLVWLKWK